MLANQLQSAFPRDVHLPESLKKLCDYADEADGLVVCDFVLSEFAVEGARAWFREKPDAADEFVMFAMDEFDSLYGFWRVDGAGLERAPIVYLNHESTGNAVLAQHLDEFLALLGIGKAEIGRVDGWSEQSAPCDDLDDYRDWLQRELELAPPADPLAVVKAAQAKFATLEQRIVELRGR